MPPLLPWTVDQSYYVTGHAPLGTPQIPQPHVQIPFGIAPSGQHVGLSADALPFVPGLVSHNANAHAPPPRAGPLRGQPALNGTSAPNPKQGQGLGSQSVGDTNGPADGASGLNGLAAPFLLQGQGSGAERGVSGLNGSAAPFNRERQVPAPLAANAIADPHTLLQRTDSQQDSDSADSSAAGSRGRPVSATAIDTPQSSPPKSIRKDSQEDLNEEEPVQASSSGTLLAKSDAGVPLGHSATFPQVNNPLSRGAVAEEREAFTQFHDRLEIFYRNVAAEPERQWRRNFHPRDADDMLTEQLASIVGASG